MESSGPLVKPIPGLLVFPLKNKQQNTCQITGRYCGQKILVTLGNVEQVLSLWSSVLEDSGIPVFYQLQRILITNVTACSYKDIKTEHHMDY